MQKTRNGNEVKEVIYKRYKRVYDSMEYGRPYRVTELANMLGLKSKTGSFLANFDVYELLLTEDENGRIYRYGKESSRGTFVFADSGTRSTHTTKRRKNI